MPLALALPGGWTLPTPHAARAGAERRAAMSGWASVAAASAGSCAAIAYGEMAFLVWAALAALAFQADRAWFAAASGGAAPQAAPRAAVLGWTAGLSALVAVFALLLWAAPGAGPAMAALVLVLSSGVAAGLCAPRREEAVAALLPLALAGCALALFAPARASGWDWSPAIVLAVQGLAAWLAADLAAARDRAEGLAQELREERDRAYVRARPSEVEPRREPPTAPGAAALAALESAVSGLASAPIPSEVRRRVDVVLDAVRHIEVLRAAAPAAASAADIRRIVVSAVDALEYAAERKGVSLVVDVARDIPPSLVVDGAALRDGVLELVAHALARTTSGGVRVRLRAAPAEGAVRIGVIVSDAGAEPAQASDLRASLALQRAAQAAKALKGRVTVKDSAGHGATFTLVFDAALPAIAPLPVAPILVVAAGEVAAALTAELRAAGLAVVAIAPGEEARARLGAGRFHAIFATCESATFDAVDVLEILRGRGDKTPVFPIVEAGDAPMAGLCRECGANDILTTPWGPGAVTALLAADANKTASSRAA